MHNKVCLPSMSTSSYVLSTILCLMLRDTRHTVCVRFGLEFRMEGRQCSFRVESWMMGDVSSAIRVGYLDARIIACLGRVIDGVPWHGQVAKSMFTV